MAFQDQVILVDETDRPIGTEEKILAHSHAGQLHRAFSVFLYDTAHRMLLQRRALEKYHFAGLWSNACCSHPRPGEVTTSAARRRLLEELGIAVDLREVSSFVYSAADSHSGFVEREFLHVFEGVFDGDCRPDPREVIETRWSEIDDIRVGMNQDAGQFTPWFRIAFDRMFPMT